MWCNRNGKYESEKVNLHTQILPGYKDCLKRVTLPFPALEYSSIQKLDSKDGLMIFEEGNSAKFCDDLLKE